jgi:DNA-binding transcriptional ArsR family regulator
MAYRLDGLAALGDPTRRAIFERVAERPRAVVELARDLPVSRPAVSQHLKVLKDAGLVVDRPHGNRRIYSADPNGLEELRAYLEQFWNTALASFKAIVERPAEETHEHPRS